MSCHNNNSLIPHLGRVRAAWDGVVLSLAKAGTKENNAATEREKTGYGQELHTLYTPHGLEWII